MPESGDAATWHGTAPPRREAGEVHLWLAAPDAIRDPELLGRYRALLPPDEERRLEAFRSERRRREYLVARALVRTSLSEYHPLGPEHWRFRAGPHGRPEIDPPAGLRFSLSHCDDLVLCAVTAGLDVGVDAEPDSRAEAILRLAARVFSPRERDALDRLADDQARSRRALQLWTLREAYGKAVGIGLSFPLRSVTFRIEPERIGVSAAGPAARAGPWDFALLHLRSHQIALAVGGPVGAPLALQLWEATPLAGRSRIPTPGDARPSTG